MNLGRGRLLRRHRTLSAPTFQSFHLALKTIKSVCGTFKFNSCALKFVPGITSARRY